MKNYSQFINLLRFLQIKSHKILRINNKNIELKHYIYNYYDLTRSPLNNCLQDITSILRFY